MNINEAFELARRYHLTGNLHKAEYMYREILSVQPSNAGAYYEIGNVLQDKGQLDEAVVFYRKTIELNPNFAGAYNNWAISLESEKICRGNVIFSESN